MALQGTIQEFGALETFQLIALQQKTGTLEITGHNRSASFVFEDGLLHAAHAAPLKLEDLLPRLLVEAGYLDEDDAKAWLNFPGAGPINPIDLLPKLCKLFEDDLNEAYDLYLQTVFDDILSLPSGRFQFHSGKVQTPSKLSGPWKVEGFLMESMRRIDELADLQAAELPPGMIPRLVPGSDHAKHPDRFARVVLSWVDGRLSLQEICAASALPAYDLYRAVRSLRDEGIIDLADWIPSGPWMDTVWQRGARWKWIPITAGSLVLLTCLTLGIQILLASFPPRWEQNGHFSFIAPIAETSRADFAMAQLMEAYRLRRGHYPAEPKNLVEEGLLSAKAAHRLSKRASVWTITADGTGYTWGGGVETSTGGQGGRAYDSVDPDPAASSSQRIAEGRSSEIPAAGDAEPNSASTSAP